MLKGKYKIATAMFDIKPVDNSGNIDVSKIANIQAVLNLGRRFKITKEGGVSLGKSRVLNNTKKEKTLIKNTKPSTPILDPRSEFESFLNRDIDIEAELASIGAEVHPEKYFKPRYHPIFAKQKPEISNDENDYQAVLAQINLRMPVKFQNDFVGEPKKIDAFS